MLIANSSGHKLLAPSSRLLALPRPPERSHAKIQKHRDHHSRRQKCPVIRSVFPTRSRSPQHGCEHQNRKEEKYADNFQQDLAAHFLERLEKPRHTAAHIARRLACISTSALRRWSRWNRTLLHVRSRARRRTVSRDGLTRRAARHPQPDPKYPPNRLRFHFDMMVAAADISSPARIPNRMPVAGAPLAK
jgi:hypothetical protein